MNIQSKKVHKKYIKNFDKKFTEDKKCSKKKLKKVHKKKHKKCSKIKYRKTEDKTVLQNRIQGSIYFAVLFQCICCTLTKGISFPRQLLLRP